jgi:hypothetical protein
VECVIVATEKINRMRLFLLNCFLFVLLAAGVTSEAQSQYVADSVKCKNAIKLDLVSLYLDFFDAQKQVRAGFEYERTFNKKSSAACLIDLGLYDDYTFIKYYDFFNQGPGGMHYTRTIAQIKGIHFLPSYNYFLFQLKGESNSGIFTGGILDFHYYRKKFSIFNSQTEIETANKYAQSTLGIGPQLGIKYGFGKHFYFEAKTCAFFKLFNIVSAKGMNDIMPLDAQWSNSKYSFWWVTQFKVCYAFGE